VVVQVAGECLEFGDDAQDVGVRHRTAGFERPSRTVDLTELGMGLR